MAKFGLFRQSRYVSNILTFGSEPVISFLIEANPFRRVCLFCNFVKNKIYVLEVEMLELVLLARYLYFMISVISLHFSEIEALST